MRNLLSNMVTLSFLFFSDRSLPRRFLDPNPYPSDVGVRQALFELCGHDPSKLLDGRVDHWEPNDIFRREFKFSSMDLDPNPRPFARSVQGSIPRGEQQAVVVLFADALKDFSQIEEIDDQAVLIGFPFDDHTYTIVMPVQVLALFMADDEMGC